MIPPFPRKWISTHKWIFGLSLATLTALLVLLIRPEVTPEPPPAGFAATPQTDRTATPAAIVADGNPDQATPIARRDAQASQRPTPGKPSGVSRHVTLDAQAAVDPRQQLLWDIQQRLESPVPLSPLGEDGGWDGSEEQRLVAELLGLDLEEVEAVALDWLLNDPSPPAVAALAGYLAAISPELYGDAIRLATELALRNPRGMALPGELFQLLGEFGDARSEDLLLDQPWHLDAYVSVALALIADGAGLDSLILDTRTFAEGRATAQGRLALELLAQRAVENPMAAATLLDLARGHFIPPDLWPSVLAAIEGRQGISLVRPAHGVLAMETILRPEGDLVLYRIALRPGEDDALEDLRLALLEELLKFGP